MESFDHDLRFIYWQRYWTPYWKHYFKNYYQILITEQENQEHNVSVNNWTENEWNLGEEEFEGEQEELFDEQLDFGGEKEAEIRKTERDDERESLELSHHTEGTQFGVHSKPVNEENNRCKEYFDLETGKNQFVVEEVATLSRFVELDVAQKDNDFKKIQLFID
eukprot:TRINITY_DN6542_c0_g1_i1.p1 TRINITY_DN6542_c0_g1~~TRINITY_DN6542_c0_g1_i1.p1  ORF type:complete len:164 (-),score=33.88 TRINITY_DN6542_c0_g1_i1:4-495(-)